MENYKIYIILALILAIVVYIIFRKNFKVLNVPSVCLVTGGVKTGKSMTCVYLSTKDYKRRVRRYNWRKFLHKPVGEQPLYYTNVFITFGNSKHRHYVKNYEKFKYKNACYYDHDRKQYYYFHKYDNNIRRITLDSLLRNERYAYGSVIYIQEASLMADNMDFKNVERNCDLSLYAKLIAHETRGGAMYLDTQSALDCHYAFKRVCSTFVFTEKNFKFLGLFHVIYVREMVNGEIGVNNFADDAETTMRKILVPWWYHNRYDCYEYSYLTDDLDISNQSLDTKGLVSFNPMYVNRSWKKRKENKNEENN